MKDVNIKSIRYPVIVDEKLDKLALKFGRTKRLFFSQMVDYFYKSKKDPYDLNDEILKKEVANGINRIISIIKRQENEFLLPIFTDTAKLINIGGVHSKYLYDIDQYLIKNEEQTKHILSLMTLLDKTIAKTQIHLNEKAVLKKHFKQILDYYIQQRESLGWNAPTHKKEKLQNHVIHSLQML
jgi:predicted DNA-binding protein